MKKIRKQCPVCKKIFEIPHWKKNKYCSLTCYHKSPNKGKPPKKPRKKCIVCGKEIPLTNKKYCSIKCAHEDLKGKERPDLRIIPEKRTCPICKKTFLVGGRNNKPKNAKYCSRECVAEALKYRRIEQYKNRASKHPYKYSRIWKNLRKEIIEERGYYCEMCGENKKILNLHHIIPYEFGGKHEKSNLMLLCVRCHNSIEYLTNKLLEENTKSKILDLINKIVSN